MERIIYKYCAVLGVDGMGNFNRNASTPNMDALFANGAVTYDALSMDPTISAENWGAMLLGLTPLVHGLTNGWISGHEYTNKEFPSVFTRIRRAFPEAYLASVCNWDPINYGIVEHDVDVDLATADNDDLLNPIIIEKVMKKPKFLFVQYDDVDGAGHGHGYGTPDYLKRIEATDALIGQVLDAYRAAGIYDETLFIIIADHGGIRHGHGGYTDEEKYIFLGAAGRGLQKSQIGFARAVDIAAIVLTALGVPMPAYDPKGFSSQVPEGLFPWHTAPYIRTPAGRSEHATLPAKRYDAGSGLQALFGDRLKLALFFDDAIRDETGRCAFTERGHIKYYSNGARAACGEFGVTGWAETADLSVGAGSFSIAVWLKTERSVNEECVVCGNKDWWWQKRRERGFSLVMKNNDTVFLMGCGNDEFGLITPYPDSHRDGWLHTVVAVDKENRELRVFYDFRLIRRFPLEEQYLCDLDSGLPFVIGNDVGGKNNTESFPNLFRMDDLLVFSGALDEADAESLKTYYAD